MDINEGIQPPSQYTAFAQLTGSGWLQRQATGYNAVDRTLEHLLGSEGWNEDGFIDFYYQVSKHTARYRIT